MNRRTSFILAGIVVLALACSALAQDDPQQPPTPPGPMAGHAMGGPMHMGMGGPGGKWWKNSQLVQKLGLSDAQVQQIEKIFQDHRLQLIDLRANLEKQETLLQPLVEADRPDDAQVSAQIDKVAQARASLEKSNALMLLGIRRVLTPDQWKALQAAHQNRGMMHGGHDHGPEGPPPAGGQAQ